MAGIPRVTGGSHIWRSDGNTRNRLDSPGFGLLLPKALHLRFLEDRGAHPSRLAPTDGTATATKSPHPPPRTFPAGIDGSAAIRRPALSAKEGVLVAIVHFQTAVRGIRLSPVRAGGLVPSSVRSTAGEAP